MHHHFRDKGVEKILQLNSGDQCRSLCFVKPILMKNVNVENTQIKEETILTGFLVIVEILANKYVTCSGVRNFKNNV